MAAACLPSPRGGPRQVPRRLSLPWNIQASPDAAQLVPTFQAIWLRGPDRAQWTERRESKRGNSTDGPSCSPARPSNPTTPLPRQLPGASLPQNSPGDVAATSISQTPVLWGWAGLESKLALKRMNV